MGFSRSAASVSLGGMSNPAFSGSGSGTAQQSSDMLGTIGGWVGNVGECLRLAAELADVQKTRAGTIGQMWDFYQTCWSDFDCYDRMMALYGDAYDRETEAINEANNALIAAGCWFR